jgi:L-Lysine epsilon oxidase N-terminal
MTTFRRIIEILDQAVGGPSAFVGAHGAFWRGVTRDQFVQKRVFGQPLVVIGNGSGSNLVKALKGERPFGSNIGTPGAGFRRMPAGRPPVSAADVTEISGWINAGCPEEEAPQEAAQPAPGERRVYRIHPGIGVARVGSSPTDSFIGPEAPGVAPLPKGPFRDSHGLIKRQAARFRIFEYRFGAAGKLAGVREITAGDASITWTVRLVNRKAEAEKFPPGSGRRNPTVSDRASLVIDSGSQSVGTAKAAPMVGKFRGREVPLGEIRTDDAGRLIVLGGFGQSEYVGPGPRRIDDFANNNDWYDDMSDGPIAATVKFPGREAVSADPAWVIVAPPKYAPEINSMMTLYDQALNAATQLDASLVPSTVSFTSDIFPIFACCRIRPTNSSCRSRHG